MQFCVLEWGGIFFCFFPLTVSLVWIIFGVGVRNEKSFKGAKHGGATICFVISVKHSAWTQYKPRLSGSDLRYPDSSPCKSCFGWL